MYKNISKIMDIKAKKACTLVINAQAAAAFKPYEQEI
jgi:hypothetical protein